MGGGGRGSDQPSGEGGVAVLTAVLLVAGVQFDVTVAGAFVLEQTHAVVAPERHLLAVCLFTNSTNRLFMFATHPVILIQYELIQSSSHRLA